MNKWVCATVVWIVWTLMCIYGTYDNTVKSAEVQQTSDGYEITYHNTGDTFSYK